MLKLKVFLICLAVLVAIFSMVICLELYALERAVARGVYTDLLDDMQDIGYLDSGLAEHYRTRMSEMGWESDAGDFFAGTWPREEAVRARKEKQELISLTFTVRPSRLSQWVHYFLSGEDVFRFSGKRPSEYFDPGW